MSETQFQLNVSLFPRA